MIGKLLKPVLLLLIFGGVVFAQDPGKTVVTTKHNKSLTVGEIAEIQPGLGTIMMEFGHRFYIAYYAAKAKNWELAKYELHELVEAQEVAETTRPKYKKQLKDFEDSSIEKLQEAVKEKDWKSFEKRYAEATKACNACHVANGHSYIRYKLPKQAPEFLDMSLR
ncbi:MAG: hypothetical protein B5M52_08350 [Helicobacteraceae bacterium 4484_230]|nr:MAG: hypothetical protein B5M52_08350 [Helicobacteraceae bacterium 4484_230]